MPAVYTAQFGDPYVHICCNTTDEGCAATGSIEDFEGKEDLLFNFSSTVATPEQFAVCRHELDTLFETSACSD